MTDETFTPTYTRALLGQVCDRVGLNADDAQLLRHQTNAVYRLSSAPVVVKIARPDYSIADIQLTVDLTHWLVQMGFPTLRLVDIEQPIIINDSAVTIWPYLPQDQSVRTEELAKPLWDLHALPSPPLKLPAIDAVAAIRYSLRAEEILSQTDHDFLVRECDHLEAALKDIQFTTVPRLIHGDPQHGNALRSEDGIVLCDWDSIAFGYPEWDLVTIEIHSRRFDHPEDGYNRFCQIYGRDIREWEGYQVLRDLRELRMITTNARKSPPGSRGALEVQDRVAQLRSGEREVIWSIL